MFRWPIPAPTVANIDDGTDTLRNFERLQFADQAVTLSGTNVPATGTVTISDTTPTEDQLLTATALVADLNGIFGPVSLTWQAET